MVFSSITFLFRFIPIFMILYFAAPRRMKNVILFLGSLVFYAWGEPVYVLLMLFSTVSDYVHGRLMRQNSGLYPERLLEALANNPEMADFVVRYLEEHEPGGLTESEKQEDFPLFLQWDPRWGYASYGKNSCIAVSGCGPTCLSMVLYYLTGNEELTPDVIGDYSMENGYYLPGTGTLWALFEDTAPLYGVYVSQPDPSEWEMKAALDGGAVLVCSMGPGDFTAGGHFIVLYGYDEDGFLINDPNCVARSRVSWSYEQLRRQMKHLWVFETKQDLPVYDYVSVTDPVW